MTTAPVTEPVTEPVTTLQAPDWRHAALCQWFATLFAAELTEAQILAYQQGEGDPIIDVLSEIPELAEPAARFRDAFNGLNLMAHPRLELAADFAAMFLMDKRSSALPYASVYTSPGGNFFSKAQEQMQQRLAANKQAVKPGFGEPSDHLAVMLDYLGEQFDQLTEHTASAEQTQKLIAIQTFVERELMNWLPAFVQQGTTVNTVCQIYPALMNLLPAFCQHLLALAYMPEGQAKTTSNS